MTINTSSAWWQAILVVLAAVLGVLGTLFYNWSVNPDREISLYSNSARSDISGPGVWPDQRTKLLTIHEFILKNSGSVGLENVRLRLSPEGGDSAYDDEFLQKLQFSKPYGGRALPSDINISRDHNAIIVQIKAIYPSDEIQFNVTNDGLADGYAATLTPTNVKLKVREATEWKPLESSGLPISIMVFLIIYYIIFAILFIYFVVKMFIFLKQKMWTNV